ncbi:hypothetical protein [Lacipirellula sp.]|uniref:hypothetical protein n=1 Tax=Lacipirellula sp. TaxID=2691419 RepID=UPI003D0B5D57
MFMSWEEVALRHRRRARRGWLILLAMLVATVWTCLFGAVGHGQCYDATIGRQLAGVKGSVSVDVVYNAYPWLGYKQVPSDHKNAIVTIDYEPTTLQGIRRQPLDPRFGSLDAIAATHRELYDALEAIRPAAKAGKTRIGVYSWFEHTPFNPEFILDSPRQYFANVRTTAELQVYPGKTLRDQMIDLGGVNWTDNYVPFGWNNETWGLEKFLIMCERKAAALEAAGVPAIPQIRPMTVGEKSVPVKPAIVRAWVLWARYRYRDQWSVWAPAGECTPEFIECLK